MNANEQQTLFLPAGQVLSVVAASGASGSAIRMAKLPGGGDAQSVTAITTGATFKFGPYADTERFNIICTAGSLTVSQAVPVPDTDATMAGNSDHVVPTQKAVKTAIAQGVAGVDTLDELLPATAENDVIVAGPSPFTWVKKTIAQFKTTLGLGTAAYTESTAYDPAGTAAGIIAPSISDSDTTHCPDGNSVFDALALKLDKAQAAPTILQLPEKTPVNAVAAERTLTFAGGNAAHRETIKIGANTYTFQTVLGAGVAAAGELTFTGNAANNEKVEIGTGDDKRTYTFANAIAELGAKATGHLTFNANPAEDEVVVIGNKTYRFRNQIAGVASLMDLVFSNVAANGETVTVDTTVYEFVTALTEAKATGILTATANPTDGNRVKIGSTYYTYRDTLADAYDVKIGASAEESLLNLVEAITYDAGAGTNEGTDYGNGTLAHPSVTAAEGALDTVDVTALALGAAGNSIATVGYGGVLAFGAATLGSGADAVANEVLVEAAAEDEINNLVAAATGGAGEGTKYSTGTTAHSTVTISKKNATTITATAKSVGTAGDAIPIDESCTDVAWTADAKFLAGGYNTAVANDVIIDAADPTNTVLALIAAITYDAGLGTNEGVSYGMGTVAHTQVTASNTLDVLDVTALSYGDAGNLIATTTDAGGDVVWGAGTLVGGEDPDTSYMVLIGADAEASIDNLVDAINRENGAGEMGTVYGTGTVIHPSVSAAKTAADVLTATAKAVGDAGNLIAVATDVALASWAGAGFLTDGDDAQTANDILIGLDAQATIDALVLAITDGTGAGTGTVAHPDVSAVKADTDKLVATAKVKGVAGNSIPIANTVTNASWAGGATALSGGIDGTVGVANETCADGSYIYHAIAANTIADANWRKITLNAL